MVSFRYQSESHVAIHTGKQFGPPLLEAKQNFVLRNIAHVVKTMNVISKNVGFEYLGSLCNRPRPLV